MDKLKANLFPIALGLAGAAIAGAFVWFVWLGWSQAAAAEKKGMGLEGQFHDIQAEVAKGSLVTGQWVKTAHEYSQKVEDEYKRCLDYYRKADERLERWLPKLKLLPAQIPTDAGQLQIEISTSLDGLKSVLKKGGVQMGKAASATAGNPFGAPTQTAEECFPDDFKVPSPDLKLAMKHYWVEERIASAAIDAHISRLESVSFPDAQPGAGGASGRNNAQPGEVAEKYFVYRPGLSCCHPSCKDPGHKTAEWTTYSFRAEIECEYASVPVFLTKLFAFTTREPLCLRIHDWKVTQSEQVLDFLRKPVLLTVTEEEKDKLQTPLPAVQPVRLTVTGEILDFHVPEGVPMPGAESPEGQEHVPQ